MKNLRMLFIISQIAIAIAFISCKSSDRQPLLPSISGRPGDLAIVINKAEWDTKTGEEFRRIFQEPFQVLPQYEPIYDIISIPHSAFNTVMQPQRNIIIVNISHMHTESKITVRKDIYARPQIIFDMYAKDDDAFVKLLTDNEKKIISLLDDMERSRLMDNNKKNLDNNIFNNLRNKHNISLFVPRGFKIDTDSDDFVWMNQEIGSIVLGILIYEYEYTDTNTFTLEYLVEKRNRFLQKYVPGEVEGSYMTTESEFEPVFTEYMLKGKRYATELRGLWKMEKGISMGGPFVSVTTLDEKRNKIVTVEGFVFAAGFNKRNYLRQVDAIVLSLEIPEK